MGSFIQQGDSIDYTPGADIAAGTCVLVGTIVGFADRALTNGVPGALRVTGIISYAKAASQAWGVGVKVYWDDSAKNWTTSASGNTLGGIAVEAVGSGAGETTGKIHLNFAS